jgi:putative hemolysin
MIVVLFGLLVVLIFLSASFSAAETALFSLSSMKVKAFRQGSDQRRILVATLLATPRDLLITIIILNILVNILIQNTAASMFGESAGWGLNVGVPLGLTLIFGEVIPKSLGLANNVAISVWIAPSLYRIQRFLSPVKKILIKITDLTSRVLFFFLRGEEEISVDELQHALTTSRQFGVLNEDEAELVQGYLNLDSSNVKQLMRPRDEVIFFNVDHSLEELIHLFVDQECSRIPICKGDLDQIIGIMTSRLFFLHRESLKSSSDLLHFIQKPFFVPESTAARTCLRKMYDRKVSLSIVVDEFGSVSGIISLEDLVETVVGEIADRRDEKASYTRSGEDVIIASGKLELKEFKQIFDIPLEGNMVTLGGWLTEELGDIPKSGTKYLTKDFLFHVLAADPNRVRRIYVRRLRKRGAE